MQINEIIVFRHRGGVHVGKLEDLAGKKIRISTGRNRIYDVPPDRVLLESQTMVDDETPLVAFKTEAQDLAESMDLRDVWELTRDEDLHFSFRDIADLHWSPPISAVQYAGMILHLARDCPYFSEHETGYLPLDEEKVEAHFQRIERKKEAQLEEQAFVDWVKSDLVTLPEEFSNRQRHALTRIQRYAMEGDEYEQSAQARDLLDLIGGQASGSLQKSAFNLMVQKGVWDEDEHLDLIRFDIPAEFDADVLAEAEEIQSTEAGREDLTHLDVFSIDDATTQDIDDALSIEAIAGGFRVGVHITDVSALVAKDSKIDKAARERTTSLYFPDRHIPMLPAELSHGHCSLLQETRRCAVSYLFDLDQDFLLVGHRIVPSIIVNKHKLSYDDVNAILESDDHPLVEPMRNLNLGADALFAQRMDAGAVELERVELSIHVGSDKEIEVTTRTGHSQADHIVSEFMIFTNLATARFFLEHQVPAIYRTQPEADFGDLGEVSHASVKRYKMIRKIRPMSLSLDPKPHAMLGAEVYCQATSPIRRYSDLVLQRQLVTVIRENPTCYSRDELTDEISLIERSRDLRKVWSRREWYWFVKYMQKETDKIHSVVVLEIRDRDLVVELLEFGNRLNIKQVEKVEVGDELKVRVTHADPWDGLLKLAAVVESEEATG
ncbi:MAG: RNB domain-containing ribonuclease [Candidatus Latescibacteria bacterium]|nr:RNB domain-containing ribonuclease [Candidatus Latescibacterota bacterium]